MAVEAKRGCGYRKVGGLYMCAPPPNATCCKFPFRLDVCPTCNHGIKQSRTPIWFLPHPFMEKECSKWRTNLCTFQNQLEEEKGLLIWIGAKYYATPEHFTDEARRMGISRRLKAIPRGFELGKTQVFFAHPNCTFTDHYGGSYTAPGVFSMCTPTRFEMIVTDNPTPKQRRRLEDERITPVAVPEFDQDHHIHTVEEPDFEELWNGNQREASNQRQA